MRARWGHHAGAGHRGGAPARWRGAAVAAAVVAAAALSLAAGAVPASAAGGYTVTATIPVGSYPLEVAVDPSTHTAYVTNADDDTVSVIDAATRAVTATIPVGPSPYGVAVDPAAGTVYVANDSAHGTVSVINAATRAVTATIPVGTSPYGVAADPAAGTVYVTSALPGGTVSVITHPVITTTSPLPPGTAGTPYTTTLHAAGGIAPWTWAITGGSLPAGLRLSPGGTITGTPAAPDTSTITAQATDHDGNTATKSLTLTIDAPDLAITLANPQPFRALRAGAYQVTVTNTGTAAEPAAMVHLDLARGLAPARAGGSGWTCRASLLRRTETCARTTPLAPRHATTFPVQTLVLAHPGTVLTSTADVTPADATPADNHASDTTRVQR